MIKFTPDYLKTSHRKSRPSRRRRKDWIDDGGPGGDNVIMFTIQGGDNGDEDRV